MIKKQHSILLLFTTLFLLVSCNNKNSGYTTIKGVLYNLDNNEIIVTYFSSDSLITDTINSDSKNRFSYTCSIDTLTSFSLYLNNQSASITFFAEPEDKINISGDAQITDVVKVTGNDINNDLTSFKTQHKDLLTQRSILYSLLTDNYDSNKLITASEADEHTNINSINTQLVMAAEEFITKNPDRLSSLIMISEFFANSESSDVFERVMKDIKPEMLKTSIGLNLNTYLKKIKKSSEGVSMPYFSLTDIDGNKVNSYDFREKYLLLSFVSSIGIDSRETIKQLKNTYKNINKDSVSFVSIYIDADLYPKEYIENDSIGWTIIPEKRSWASDIVDIYNIEFVPNNILISPNGIIDRRNVSATSVFQVLKKLSQD